MDNYQFQLEKYNTRSSRYTCPKCRGRKTFTRYIDTLTGTYVHDTVGRCDRQDRCGYHYPPRDYFNEHHIDHKDFIVTPETKPETIEEPPSFIDPDILERSLNCYENNNFVQFLIRTFGKEKTEVVIGQYYIGTSKRWRGATVFWQVDRKGKIRTGKVMLYNPDTGKRLKGNGNYVAWVHKACSLEDFNLVQCLYGEHLLSDNIEKTVAIVESEKTAIIASLFVPEMVWLASGGKEGLAAKAGVLKGRNVILFPDAGCFEKWNKIAIKLSAICNIYAHGVLETNITEAEKKEGYDIADYLLAGHKT